jgi:hypothetical protein
MPDELKRGCGAVPTDQKYEAYLKDVFAEHGSHFEVSGPSGSAVAVLVASLPLAVCGFPPLRVLCFLLDGFPLSSSYA